MKMIPGHFRLDRQMRSVVLWVTILHFLFFLIAWQSFKTTKARVNEFVLELEEIPQSVSAASTPRASISKASSRAETSAVPKESAPSKSVLPPANSVSPEAEQRTREPEKSSETPPSKSVPPPANSVSPEAEQRTREPEKSSETPPAESVPSSPALTESKAPPVSAPPPSTAGTASIPNSDADYKAAYLHNPKPPYPPIAYKLRLEGEVVLRVEVKADGSVGQVALVKTSGHASLDNVAIETVHRWRFQAAHREGAAVAQFINIPISFNIVKSGGTEAK